MPPRPRKHPPLTEEQLELVKQHRELVVEIASHVRPTFPASFTFDELISAGLKGLMDAARLYDSNVGSTFRNFAYTRIRGAMIDDWRAMGAYKGSQVKAHKAKEDLEERRARGEVQTATFERLRQELTGAIQLVSMDAASAVPTAGQSPETAAHVMGLRKKLAHAIEELRTQERDIVRLVHLEGKTLEEAGKEKGWSKSWASRVHASALELLKLIIDGDG